MAATEANTAKVLAEDREGLRKLLQHAGFSLDDASITIVTRDAGGGATRVDAAASGARQGDAGSQSAGSGAQSGAQPGDRDPRERQSGERSGRRPAPEQDRMPVRTPSASTFL